MTKRTNKSWMTASFAALLSGALILAAPLPAANADDAAKVKPVASEKLPNFWRQMPRLTASNWRSRATLRARLVLRSPTTSARGLA